MHNLQESSDTSLCRDCVSICGSLRVLVEQTLHNSPAYQKLLTDGTLDQCGITLLAGKAVGTPFVGAVAATLSVAEILRLLHGGVIHQLVDFGSDWD